MKIILFILTILCFLASGFAEPKINQYIKAEKPNEDDIVVVAFQYPVGCIKCVLQIEDIIKFLTRNFIKN